MAAADMKDELLRLQTFENAWPHRVPSANDMATNGFYRVEEADDTESKDTVQCASCDVQVHGWDRTDDVLDRHLRESSQCEFAQSLRRDRESASSQLGLPGVAQEFSNLRVGGSGGVEDDSGQNVRDQPIFANAEAATRAREVSNSPIALAPVEPSPLVRTFVFNHLHKIYKPCQNILYIIDYYDYFYVVLRKLIMT